jgi:hypothetical protein
MSRKAFLITFDLYGGARHTNTYPKVDRLLKHLGAFFKPSKQVRRLSTYRSAKQIRDAIQKTFLGARDSIFVAPLRKGAAWKATNGASPRLKNFFAADSGRNGGISV